MFFDGYSGGRCPIGDSHVAQGLNFVLPHDVQSGPTAQEGWRFCQNCNSMFFEGYGGGECPAGGKHSAQGVRFVLPHDMESTQNTQAGWRFCQNCHAMFFSGYGGGRCPATGATHSAQGAIFSPPYRNADAGQAAVLNLGGGMLIMALPEAMVNDFVNGVMAGAQSNIPSDILLQLETKIVCDPDGFQLGYALGCLGGLLTGLKNLLKTVIDIFKLAVALSSLSPAAISTRLGQEAFMLLSSAAHRELRKRQIAQAQAIADAVEDTIADIALHPDDYRMFSSDVGIALGQVAGTWFTNYLLQKSAREIGETMGSVVGLVLFEIIIQILLAVFTEGAGNAARAGMGVGEGIEAARAGIALGEGAEGGMRIAGLAQKLKAAAMSRPGILKLIRTLTSLYKDERGAAFLAALDAELELAFGEGAVLQRGARGGFPVLEKVPGLSADARTAAAKLLGQEFSPELQAAWNACSNPQAVAELADVQRLLGTGSAADREAAYALSERTYGNWRNRFWTRVRGDNSLRKIFTDSGASFDKGGAPYFDIGGGKTKNLTITLDHFIERRVDNPARAVDALNVRPSISFENSATLEAIRKDNFLKGWKSPIDL
jgi:hypothetical protein